MNRRTVAVLGLLAAARIGAATPGTCTVSRARVLADGDFGKLTSNPDPPLAGYAIPIDVDEATGTFRLDVSAVPDMPFSLVISGLLLNFDDVTFQGTIDAGGNVVIPSYHLQYTITAGGPPFDVEETLATLSTGISGVTITGVEFRVVGTPLDFSSGVLTLEALGVILNAPMAGSPVGSGLTLTCTLSPIPDKTKLPAGPSLKNGVVKAKFGKAKNGAAVGDQMQVKTLIQDVGDAAALAQNDLFVRVTSNGSKPEPMLLRIPAGTLAQKGKKLGVKDPDGSALRLVSGRKQVTGTDVPFGGTVTVTAAKGAFNVSVKLVGIDLCALGDTSTLGISIGGRVATRDVKIKPKGKSACGA